MNKFLTVFLSLGILTSSTLATLIPNITNIKNIEFNNSEKDTVLNNAIAPRYGAGTSQRSTQIDGDWLKNKTTYQTTDSDIAGFIDAKKKIIFNSPPITNIGVTINSANRSSTEINVNFTCNIIVSNGTSRGTYNLKITGFSSKNTSIASSSISSSGNSISNKAPYQVSTSDVKDFVSQNYTEIFRDQIGNSISQSSINVESLSIINSTRISTIINIPAYINSQESRKSFTLEIYNLSNKDTSQITTSISASNSSLNSYGPYEINDSLLQNFISSKASTIFNNLLDNKLYDSNISINSISIVSSTSIDTSFTIPICLNGSRSTKTFSLRINNLANKDTMNKISSIAADSTISSYSPYEILDSMNDVSYENKNPAAYKTQNFLQNKINEILKNLPSGSHTLWIGLANQNDSNQTPYGSVEILSSTSIKVEFTVSNIVVNGSIISSMSQVQRKKFSVTIVGLANKDTKMIKNTIEADSSLSGLTSSDIENEIGKSCNSEIDKKIATLLYNKKDEIFEFLPTIDSTNPIDWFCIGKTEYATYGEFVSKTNNSITFKFSVGKSYKNGQLIANWHDKENVLGYQITLTGLRSESLHTTQKITTINADTINTYAPYELNDSIVKAFVEQKQNNLFENLYEKLNSNNIIVDTITINNSQEASVSITIPSLVNGNKKESKQYTFTINGLANKDTKIIKESIEVDETLNNYNSDEISNSIGQPSNEITVKIANLLESKKNEILSNIPNKEVVFSVDKSSISDNVFGSVVEKGVDYITIKFSVKNIYINGSLCDTWQTNKTIQNFQIKLTGFNVEETTLTSSNVISSGSIKSKAPYEITNNDIAEFISTNYKELFTYIPKDTITPSEVTSISKTIIDSTTIQITATIPSKRNNANIDKEFTFTLLNLTNKDTIQIANELDADSTLSNFTSKEIAESIGIKQNSINSKVVVFIWKNRNKIFENIPSDIEDNASHWVSVDSFGDFIAGSVLEIGPTYLKIKFSFRPVYINGQPYLTEWNKEKNIQNFELKIKNLKMIGDLATTSKDVDFNNLINEAKNMNFNNWDNLSNAFASDFEKWINTNQENKNQLVSIINKNPSLFFNNLSNQDSKKPCVKPESEISIQKDNKEIIVSGLFLQKYSIDGQVSDIYNETSFKILNFNDNSTTVNNEYQLDISSILDKSKTTVEVAITILNQQKNQLLNLITTNSNKLFNDKSLYFNDSLNVSNISISSSSNSLVEITINNVPVANNGIVSDGSLTIRIDGFKVIDSSLNTTLKINEISYSDSLFSTIFKEYSIFGLDWQNNSYVNLTDASNNFKNYANNNISLFFDKPCVIDSENPITNVKITIHDESLANCLITSNAYKNGEIIEELYNIKIKLKTTPNQDVINNICNQIINDVSFEIYVNNKNQAVDISPDNVKLVIENIINKNIDSLQGVIPKSLLDNININTNNILISKNQITFKKQAIKFGELGNSKEFVIYNNNIPELNVSNQNGIQSWVWILIGSLVGFILLIILLAIIISKSRKKYKNKYSNNDYDILFDNDSDKNDDDYYI